VDCDASGNLIAYFSKKFNEAKKRYSTYDLELDEIMQALNHWRHYFPLEEFILLIDH
jgi:hypothetical protein